jgi:hypothetical protein
MAIHTTITIDGRSLELASPNKNKDQSLRKDCCVAVYIHYNIFSS